MKQIIVQLFLVFQLFISSVFAAGSYQTFGELLRDMVLKQERPLQADGIDNLDNMGGFISFGGEKEGSSGLITRVMGPSSESMKNMVASLGEEKQEEFLRDFFTNYFKNANGYRTYRDDSGQVIDLARDVLDMDGTPKTINLEQLKRVDLSNASVAELVQLWDEFLEMTDDRPLSFIKPSIRKKLFKGDLIPGVQLSQGYYDYRPHFGKAQKYIEAAHPTSVGWEINFKPMNSFAGFEEQISWFRNSLKNKGKLFHAFGHQRVVFNYTPDLNKAKLSELFRAIQALIVVDGLKGKTGLETASFKPVLPDDTIEGLNSGRGIIRLEGERFGGMYSIEFRAGTKDLRLARFYQASLAARLANNDFEDLKAISDYSLIGYNTSIQNKLNVDTETFHKAVNNLRMADISSEFQVPLWNWLDAPFVSPTKKELLKSLTEDFVKHVAQLDSSNTREIRESMVRWVKGSGLSKELSEYIRPKSSFPLEAMYVGQAPRVDMRSRYANAASNLWKNRNGKINVDKIDMGIEFSGKFPMKLEADYLDEANAENWIRSNIDLTIEERKAVIEKVAKDLLDQLGGSPKSHVQEIVEANGHGHGFDLAYEFKDRFGRQWRVEWDGIGRSYDEAGEVIESSLRGGSIELVTPKFIPNEKDVSAVFKAFELNSITPNIFAGGGHINIDLAPFQGKPEKMARFIELFNRYRATLAMTFQSYDRLKSAEPIELSDNLMRSLSNFSGSEDDLKKLLYNERYFNTRQWRKSRYSQLDLSAYFQDVIPSKFIDLNDFDIANPTVPWRPSFRVKDHIRKAELRMFDAPRDAAESALQIRVVRALLEKTFNSDEPIEGASQAVDLLEYVKNPQKAYSELEQMADFLELPKERLEAKMSEALAELSRKAELDSFENFAVKMQDFPKFNQWDEAINPASRGASSSADDLTMIDSNKAANTIGDHSPSGFRRSSNCLQALRSLLTP